MSRGTLLKITSRKILQTLLHRLHGAPVSSLPLQYKIWYIEKDVLPTGRVYVDKWPDFRYVAALHTSEEFSNTYNYFDTDFTTFYYTGHAEKQSMKDFFAAVADERKWTAHRSLCADCTDMVLPNAISGVLSPHGHVETFDGNGQGYRLYTVVEQKNISLYESMVIGALKKLPAELYLDILHSEDTKYLAPHWHYADPEFVTEYLGWLIEKFPTTCVRRKKDHAPIAWMHSYGCGGLGNAYVIPEYRGAGLPLLFAVFNALKLIDFCPLQPFFAIQPGNFASHKASAKTYAYDWTPTEYMTMSFFFYNQSQMPMRVRH